MQKRVRESASAMEVGLTGLLGLALALAPASGTAAQQVDSSPPGRAVADVAGRWRLNEKESENPQAKFRPLAPGEVPGQAGVPEPPPTRGRFPGRGTPDRPRPMPSGEPAKLETPPGFEEFLDPPKALAIAGDAAALTFDSGAGEPLRLVLDGIERRQGPLRRAARWEGTSIVVESSNGAGARLTTRYNPMAGERRLEVYARLAGKDGRAVTLRRVYVPAEATP